MASAWESAPLVGAAPAASAAAPAWSAAPLVSAAATVAPPAASADDGNIAQGIVRGFNRLVSTGGNAIANLMPDTPRLRAQRAQLDQFNNELDASNAGSTLYKVGDVGGQVIATSPVGGVLGAGAKAVGLNRLAAALGSAGGTTGAPTSGFLSGAGDLALRSGASAATGGVSAGLIDPENTAAGAAIGAALPPVARIGAAVGDGLGAILRGGYSLVKPFLASGQQSIVGSTLNRMARDPEAAIAALKGVQPPVNGSLPTTTMAAGDEGLSGLHRTLQSTDPEFAANLASREAEQNAARTNVLQNMAGNPGKIAAAQEARDQATGAIRDSVLTRAGNLPVEPVTSAIDTMLADPDNAGKLAQTALTQFKNQISGASSNGQVSARALYAIRKDVNDLMQGKLSGDAGNLRYANSQLGGVKGIIDDAIHEASTQPTTALATMDAIGAPSVSPPSWRDYLSQYSAMSRPIDQMSTMSDVLKQIQNGSVDKLGNATLSAAKLNNVLKNQGADLSKTLTPEQMNALRSVASDMNASQLGASAGRAVGSNTVQNLAGANTLYNLLGGSLGGSTLASSTLGGALKYPYVIANKQIAHQLGDAMLDPQGAATLMSANRPSNGDLFNLLSRGAISGASRVVPLLQGNTRQ